MNRFFVNKENILEDGYIKINDKEDIRHMLKILRLNTGDNIEISDSCDHEYIAKIKSISESEIELKILEKREFETESDINITLFQCIPKSDKLEMVVQKSTELGISEIFPLISRRTVVQINSKNKHKKLERWRKIASEAAKQSKRGIIPYIHAPMEFKQLLELITHYDLVVMPYEKEKKLGLRELLKQDMSFRKIAIVIGPEGGFDEDEVLAAKNLDAVPVTLGPRILRTETAGLVVLSILMYEIGDLGGI